MENTNRIDIEALSTTDLKRLTAAASETIESRRSEEQATALNEIKEIIQNNDLSADQVMDFINPKPKSKAGRPRKNASNAPKATKATASKSPPKYREPESGATWTGKGRKPEWIKAAADPEKFLIPEGERTNPPAAVLGVFNTEQALKPEKAPKTPKPAALDTKQSTAQEPVSE